MSAVTNTVKNDDLDELTAMLQSLDEPVQKAAKMSGVDEIQSQNQSRRWRMKS